MTMFTATALLDGITRGKLRGIMGDFSTYMAFEYQGWHSDRPQIILLILKKIMRNILS